MALPRPIGDFLRHEKTQAGNPYRLSVRQHVFPKASIQRFMGQSRCVDILDRVRTVRRRASPDDALFCAMRAWSHREEIGFMRRIEGEYQSLMKGVISGLLTTFTLDDNQIVSNFFALWYARARFRKLDGHPTKMSLLEDESLTKDEEEMLESKGIVFARKGVIASRLINGVRIQMLTYRFSNTRLKNVRWGIIQASVGEFVVPDVPHVGIVPLTPTTCLVADQPSGICNAQSVADINYNTILFSRDYYFARDLDACPICSGSEPTIL